MEDPSYRPAYSRSQIENYFHLISLPQRYREQALEISKSDSTDQQLEFLTSLQQHQLANVPFENLAIHYSIHHTVSIDADDLYTKIVGNARGRGGYCMENNCFFGTILRTLGFEEYGVGGRIADAVNGSTGGGFGGWYYCLLPPFSLLTYHVSQKSKELIECHRSHMVNLVTLASGQKYMLDVGFGSDCATRPLPLTNSLETGDVLHGIGAQQLRLIYSSIEPATSPDQNLWIFQRRYSASDEWRTAYCFTELEFLPRDYGMMNYYTSTCRTVFFTYAIIVVKLVMDGEELAGEVIMTGSEVKRRIRGKTEHLVSCKSEGERVAALERWFRLRLTSEERRGIRGTVTELKG
ncbi:MAG: hypothetical protein Q9195_006475 [Heterodermia aff. obscurata]